MKHIPILVAKELKGYFYSPIAYIVIAASLLINGWTFWLMVNYLNNPMAPVAGSIMKIFFGGTFFYWFQIILLSSVITMRLFSEERRSGTIEVLMTAPLSDIEVVLSKFFSALLFFMIMWGPTLVYMYILQKYASVDIGPVLTGYIGTFCAGGLFLSIGLMASSLTKNQVIAAVISFALSIVLFSLAFLSGIMKGNIARNVLSYIGILEHFEDFGKGVIDTRAILFYVTIVVFNLFITVRIVEARKWR